MKRTNTMLVSFVPLMRILAKPARLIFAVMVLATLASAASAAPSPSESLPSESFSSASEHKQSRPRRSRRRPAVPNRPPPNRVQPGGGLDASVQACSPESRPLTAIVPVENPVFTAVAHPTFLFYFPDDPAAVNYAEFILLSADEKEEIYTTRFTPTAPGIASVSLPATAEKALEAGQSYHWYLNVHCHTTSGVPSVNGWVQRVADGEQIVQSPDSQMPRLWYDQVARTAALLTGSQSVISATAAAGSDPQRQWNALLSAAGLGDLIEIPVVGDVVVEPDSSNSAGLSVTEGL